MTNRFEEMADAICDLINCDDIAVSHGDEVRCGDEEYAYQIQAIFDLANIKTKIVTYDDYPTELSPYDGTPMRVVTHDPYGYFIEPVKEENENE